MHALDSFCTLKARSALLDLKAYISRYCSLVSALIKLRMTSPFYVPVYLAPTFLGNTPQGDFSPTCSWLYLSFVVNISVCYAFYCLGMFYYVLKQPLKPYDPVPKFLCIKAVLFLSFWQVMDGVETHYSCHRF